MEAVVLLKQVPAADAIDLDGDLRLARDHVASDVDPFSRRALGWALASGARVTALAMGPPSAEEVLAWALASGAHQAVLVTDPRLRGSDALVTAKVLARAITHLGRFDLVVLGRFSADGSTGQLGPTLASLLDRPFVHAANAIDLDDSQLVATSDLDDGTRRVATTLPAVVAVAERLVAPPKPSNGELCATDRARIDRPSLEDLGIDFPVGAEGSPTIVLGASRQAHQRAGRTFGGPPDEQLAALAAWLTSRVDAPSPAGRPRSRPALKGAILCDPSQPGATRASFDELAGAIDRAHSHLVALGDPCELPVDEYVMLSGSRNEHAVARSVASWLRDRTLEVMVAPATDWSREVLARVAATLDLGLIGEATSISFEHDALHAAKPVGVSDLVATVTTRSAPALATLRATVAPLPPGEHTSAPPTATLEVRDDGLIRVLEAHTLVDLAALESARVLLGVGLGVAEADLPWIEKLAAQLGAELVASRKVADRGWLPRARQLGVTGKRLAPALYLAVGIRGTTNHLVGASGAGLVIAVNSDPSSEVVRGADATLVADYRQVLAPLVELLASTLP